MKYFTYESEYKYIVLPYELVIQNTISNICFLWMEVLEVSLTDNRVRIYADTDLLKHSVYVCA